MIKTSEGERLTAPHIMITSGSTPAPVPIEGGELAINSDDFFDMEELPKSAVVIGGGYIGVEFAQILHAFGVHTHLLVRSKVLRFVDQEVVSVLEECMQKTELNLVKGKKHTKFVKNTDTGLIDVHLEDGSILSGEKVIVALGRPPLVGPLKLEKAGVEVDSNGAIIVDEYQNTNVEGIFALGDVINKVNLTPVAIRAGRILAERLYNNRPGLKCSYENVATVIFSHPPIGTVGLPQDEAEQKFGSENVTVHKSRFINMFYSPCKIQEKKLPSFFKIVCHKQPNGDEKVVGVHGTGLGIDEMMQGLSIAVTMGATKQDFDNSVAIHPTASEDRKSVV